MRFAGIALALAFFASCSNRIAAPQAAANLRAKRGDLAGALAELRAAARIGTDAVVWTGLADALFEAQRYEEAERSYRTALSQAPSSRGTRRGLAQLLLRRGRLDETEALLTALAREAPFDTDAQLALGTLLVARGDLTGGRRALETALTQAPRHAAALYNLARLDIKTGDLNAAERRSQELERTSPKAPYGSYARALMAAGRGRSDLACRALAEAQARGLADPRAVERDPELAPVREAPCLKALLSRSDERDERREGRR